jgi:hypothetical protein
MVSNRGGGGDGKTPTTAPPPFDPEQYARDSEVALKTVSESDPRPHSTAEVPPAPPLNQRVRLNVPLADLAWFELSEGALALAERIDGSHTLLELLEGLAGKADVEAVAQLHDAGVLAYETPTEPPPTQRV